MHASFRGHHNKTFEDLKQFFSNYFNDPKIKMKNIACSYPPKIPIQANTSDCGLLTCLTLGIISRKDKVVEDIKYNVKAKGFSMDQRKMLANELVEG